MAYIVAGIQGALTSWGSTNQNSTILSGITPASVNLRVMSDTPNVSGLGNSYESHIPGLKFSNGSISGYNGSAPALGATGNVAYSAGGYALHVYSAEVTIRTTTVHDITELNAGSQWMRFRPDALAWSMRYTAGIDSATALVLPPDTGASIPTVTLTYATGATLAGSGVIRQVSAAIVRGQKSIATYEVQGSGTLGTVGGVFGTSTLGSTANAAPLWAAGGSATGAMVITAVTSRTYTLSDSFWTSIRLRWTPAAPVAVDIDFQGDGSVTPA